MRELVYLSRGVHYGTVAKAPNPPVDVCGYARLLRCHIPIKGPQHGPLVLATPLFVEYAPPGRR